MAAIDPLLAAPSSKSPLTNDVAGGSLYSKIYQVPCPLLH